MARASRVITTPRIQTVPQVVLISVVWLLSLVISSQLPAVGGSALVLIASASLLLAIRNLTSGWEVDDEGLVTKGLVFTRLLPAAQISRVVLYTSKNALRIEASSGGGRSIPLGNAVVTATSIERGRGWARRMVAEWDVPYVESGASGASDPFEVWRTPAAVESRRLRGGPAPFVLGAVWVLLTVLRAFG